MGIQANAQVTLAGREVVLSRGSGKTSQPLEAEFQRTSIFSKAEKQEKGHLTWREEHD